MNDYKIESRSRWGDTDAYREHERKTKEKTRVRYEPSFWSDVTYVGVANAS